MNFLDNLLELELLGKLWDQLMGFLPKLIFALIILIIGWIIAKIVARIIKKILKSVKIDVLADKLNDIDIVRKANLKILPSNVLSKTVYYVLMLLTAVVATEKLGVAAVTDLITDFIKYLPQLFSAFLFFIIGLLIADAIRGIILTACKSLGIPSANIIASVVFYFIFLSVTMSALRQAGVATDFIESNLSIVIAGAVGAFAFGYGLASKGMMVNFLATFYTKDKFKIDDKITVGGVKGQIVGMDNTSFTLKTENSKVVFPLSKLTEKEVEIH